MPPIQHFEFPADDVERARKFYKEVFGWEMEKWGNPENPNKENCFVETKDGEWEQRIEWRNDEKTIP